MSKKNIISKISESINNHQRGLDRLIFIFGGILALFITLIVVDNYELISFSKTIINVLKTLAVIVSSYFIASVIIRFTSSWSVRFIREEDIETKLIMSKVYSFMIYLLATAFVLWKIGVTIQNIALISGLIATGLAFALREVLLSFFVWLILLVKKPFRIGDNIKIGEEEGVVKHIGIFYVHVDNTPESYDDYVKVPNKIFIDKAIYNYGKKPVPIKISMNINAATKDIYKKIKLLTEKMDFVEIYKKPYLENPKDNFLYITTIVYSEYHKRTENRTKITELIIEIFK